MTYNCYACKFHSEHIGYYKRHLLSKKHKALMVKDAKIKAEAIEAAKVASNALLHEDDEEDDEFDVDMTKDEILEYYKESIRSLKKQIKMKNVRIDMLEKTTVTNITNNIKVVINDPNIDDRAIGPIYMCVQQAMKKKGLNQFCPMLDTDSIKDGKTQYDSDENNEFNTDKYDITEFKPVELS